MPLIESFGLDADLLAAPIAGDWVDYNKYDNQGEHMSKEDFLKILRSQNGENPDVKLHLKQ